MTTPTMITAPETDPLQEKIRYHASRAADCVITRRTFGRGDPGPLPRIGQ